MSRFNPTYSDPDHQAFAYTIDGHEVAALLRPALTDAMTEAIGALGMHDDACGRDVWDIDFRVCGDNGDVQVLDVQITRESREHALLTAQALIRHLARTEGILREPVALRVICEADIEGDRVMIPAMLMGDVDVPEVGTVMVNATGYSSDDAFGHALAHLPRATLARS